MKKLRNFNPQASCEARLIEDGYGVIIKISIHRPPARPDHQSYIQFYSLCHFNPQASCEARLLALPIAIIAVCISIHRPPARPDFKTQLVIIKMTNFNPQASCEARQNLKIETALYSRFQSTGLLRGPTFFYFLQSILSIFQSTGLLRGPTYAILCLSNEREISIHRPPARPDEHHTAEITLG